VSEDDRIYEVNRPEESIAIDFGALCVEFAGSGQSPIDDYYSHASDILRRARQQTIADDELILRLLILEIISSAEHYFRSVLASLVHLCPLISENSLRKQLSLAAMKYYSAEWVGLGLIEHAALSGEGELKKQTLQLTGFQIKEGSSVAAALIDFEKICHMRHSIVHSRSELNARNLIEMGVYPRARCKLQMTVLSLQSILAKSHNAVRAYNSWMMQNIVRSWIAKKILKGSWKEDGAHFARIYELFYSVADGVGEPDPAKAYQVIKTFL
jgi:hypothetical protein